MDACNYELLTNSYYNDVDVDHRLRRRRRYLLVTSGPTQHRRTHLGTYDRAEVAALHLFLRSLPASLGS